MSLFISADQLLENFAFLDQWEERYAYVIDLGKNLAPFPEELKTDENLVRGCTSRVWLVSENSKDNTVNFIADSDAHIVRGLIGILTILYNHQPKETIRQFPIEDYFAKLGLSEHLSPSRRNGFFAMVERIKSLAA